MAIHFSSFAWEILWTEEAGGLQFMESHRDGRDRMTEHIVDS